MFPDDADSLRATARRLRAIAAGCFDWRDQGTETETQIVDMHEREARKQMLAIAQGFDRLAERVGQRAHVCWQTTDVSQPGDGRYLRERSQPAGRVGYRVAPRVTIEMRKI
jgi:hypothetical protein